MNWRRKRRARGQGGQLGATGTTCGTSRFAQQDLERQLQETQERFHALATATGQIVWATGPDGLVEDAPYWCAYTGQSRDEVRGWGWLEAVHPADRERTYQVWSQAVATQSRYEIDYRVLRVDGVYHPFLTRGVPVFTANGSLLEWVGISTDISERKELEEALRESEAHLRATFEHAPVGIGNATPEGQWFAVNQQLCDILGYTQEELLTRTWQEITHPDDLQTSLEWRQQLWEGRCASYALEKRYLRKDGSPIWIKLTVSLVQTPEGVPHHTIAIIEDISQRKQSEAEKARLLERERRERVQAEATTRRLREQIRLTELQLEVSTALTASGTLHDLLSPCARALVEHLGAAFARVWTLNEAEQVLELQASAGLYTHLDGGHARVPLGALKIGRIAQARLPHVTNDVLHDPQIGDPDWAKREGMVAFAGYPLLIGERLLGVMALFARVPFSEATFQALATVANNIALGIERRLLERWTHDALGALLEMAEALVAPACPVEVGFSEDTRTGISALAQRLLEMSARVLGCERVGIAAIEPETTQLLPLAIVTPDPEEQRQWWERRPSAPRLSESADPPLLERLSSGEVMLLDTRSSPIRVLHPFKLPMLLLAPMCVGKRLVGLLSIGHDNARHVFAPQEYALAGALAKLTALVIERDHLLRQREEAQASVLAIREANRQLETFLGMASHELKTPLTSILMAQEMLQRRLQRLLHSLAGAPEDAARQAEAAQALADTTLQHGGRLNRLVSDLLDTSRIQAGCLTLHLTRVDLGMIVRSAVEEQRQAAPERLILLRLQSQGSVLVRADAERLGQVVTNYLTNALKYSDEASPVEVGVQAEDQQGRVWVRDQGPGIPPGEQERLWERFHRVPGIEVLSGSGIGLGIGLYISKTIIEQHGGQVGVQSTPGAGATFWFTLPLASPDQPFLREGG